MESRKKNWNNFLKNIIASSMLVVFTLLIGLIFVPIRTTAAGTISRQQLKDYNVHFNSALTSVRSANGLSLKSAIDHNKQSFQSYVYEYNGYTDTTLYYGTNDVIAQDGTTDINLSANISNLYTYTEINRSNIANTYIPSNANYFDNVQGQKETLFGNEIGEGDFVLLNNYTSHQESTNSTFNVENMYISFGSPYNAQDSDTTLIYDLTVTAKLYSTYIDVDGIQQPVTHEQLVLNEVSNSKITENKLARYWSQYLDLRDLTAYSEAHNTYYSVENPQGKYEFTFIFTRYKLVEGEYIPLSNDNSESAQETFQYTFYLLDSADYTNYPTLQNGELTKIENGQASEYFYNFTEDTPYISYDPTKYNLSYTRTNNLNANNLADANISSNFVNEQYTFNGKVFDKYILTYYNGTQKFKEVFILVNYNEARTIVEYLYLSRSHVPATDTYNPIDYSVFETALENGTLKFEYKTINVLSVDSNTYSLITYKTTEYDNHSLTSNFNTLNLDTSYEEIDSLTFYNDNNTIKKDSSTGTALITFGSYPESSATLENFKSGVVVDAKTLATAQNQVLKATTYKYQLLIDDNQLYTLKRSYLDSANQEQYVETELPTDVLGSLQKIENDITIDYIVEDILDEGTGLTTRQITAVTLSNQTIIDVSNIVNSNQKNLNDIVEIIRLKQVPFGFTYELELKELGIYNFKYSYVCTADSEKYYINSTETATNTINNSQSTNYTTPVDYDITYTSKTSDTQYSDTNIPLYAVVSKPLSTSNQANIFGIDYAYEPAKAELVFSGSTQQLTNNQAKVLTTIGSEDYDVIYQIETIAGNKHLTISYPIGTVASSTTITPYTSYIQNKEGYRVLNETKTTYTYELSMTTENLENLASYAPLQDILARIESYPDDGDVTTTNKYVLTTMSTSYSGVSQGKDKLHIFGSMTYFNKANSTTDSGYAKLEQIDSKENLNYRADVTNLFYTEYVTDTPATDDPLYSYPKNADFSKVAKNSFQRKIATLLTREKIIVTDVTPVLWNNFSTLSYNGKKSNSYIFRYTDYEFDDNGKINLDNASCQTSTYNKDVYCQFDGLYEIVVFYTYSSKSNDQIYYQVFTFIIDNSSPTLNIQVNSINEDRTVKTDNDKNIQYELLGLNKYTNRIVRLTWEVPTYFQNDVYAEIVRTSYEGIQNLNVICKNGTISATGTSASIANQIISMGKMQEKDANDKLKNYFYVIIADPDILDSDESLVNGNYKIIMHYNAGGKSTFTEEFVIDKEDISGLSILPIIKGMDGTFSLQKSVANDFNPDAQIINTDFTFRFNRKDSQANIFAYYDKIPLSSYDNYDQIISASKGFGLTTKSYLNGDDTSITIGTQYVYDYTHESDADHVSNKNVLISNNSCIYLFRLVDEAGNECRYIVFYDTTEPRFLTSPEPDPITHVVNSTTRVVWGDYKAIKVLSDDSITSEIIDKNSFDVTKAIDNYKYAPDTVLQLALRYMNTNNVFNGLKVEKINNNYYILIPITQTTIEDNEYNNPVNIEGYTEYYFFPTNPITQGDNGSTITLPQFNADGSIKRVDGKVETKTFSIAGTPQITSINNYSGEPVQRYISLSYYTTDDKSSNAPTATIIGAIGEGRFLYSVNDALHNQTSGLIWMNLDRTQTIAYGLYDYSDDVSKASPFINTEGSFSASKMFVSSLTSTKDNNIPSYAVTYKQFRYDYSLYQDYTIQSIAYREDPNSKATFLDMVMTHNTEANISKEISVQLTDEDGGEYPRVSFPYSLDGEQEVDAYAEGFSYLKNDTSRKFSLAISTTTDTNKQKVVSEEGLYVFKREYTANADDFANLQDSTNENYVEGLETDKRIIYRVYYIDRSGIINITANSTTASKLYQIGNSIGFSLGSDYAEIDADYQYDIKAETIQHNQKSANSTYSNADYESLKLFNTNKVLVEFSRSYDKHNFEQFSLDNKVAYKNIVDGTDYSIGKTFENDDEQNEYNATIRDLINKKLKDYLFNEDYFSNKMYRVELNLSVNNSNIINESKRYYSNAGISEYLTTENRTIPTISESNRATEYYFYYDIQTSSSEYYAYAIGLNDQSGHDKFNDDGTVADDNYLANSLDITFDVSHTAPEGDFYGKYYGRENYDKNSQTSNGGSQNSTNGTSIPIGPNGEYNILAEYLDGQLDPLSSSRLSNTSSADGDFVQLLSTNNETLIFTFSITNDPTQAQIDPNNIQIYKDGVADSNLIFNRVNGNCVSTALVPEARQLKAFVKNTIDNITYYAIVIFDNNLDDILDKEEKERYDFRLLNSEQNNDKATYYAKLRYVGEEDNYQGSNNNSFHQTTYSIDIDRIKPTYNLTKLMALDKYTYNTVSTTVTAQNYESVFAEYKPFYNFQIDPNRPEMEYERSDIENYFFALDCREESSFVFESVSTHDNNNGILYLRKVDKNNYKFSVTPDDYRAYYTTEYLTGHQQFTPSSAITVDGDFLTNPNNKLFENTYNYYRFNFNTFSNAQNNSLSAYTLYRQGIFQTNQYYEIIETDEAGNYRVYAVYIPEQNANYISYQYQKNSSLDSLTSITIAKGNNPYYTSSGMKLQFNDMRFKDNFLRANLNIKTNSFTHFIDITLNPNTLEVTILNRTTGEILDTLISSSKDIDISGIAYANTNAFKEAINYILDYYYERINNKSDSYYSEYGYTVEINIIDRLGVNVTNMNRLYNYEISYVVAGSTLSPIFIDNQTNFIMRLEGQKGSTYLCNITESDTNNYKPGIVVYKFNKGWIQISYDNSSTPQSFNKSNEDLKKPIDYVFTRGVYKFVFTDNFNRTLEFFHEFGISSSQTGGSLNFYGDKVTLSDGYTYSNEIIEYSYDSSVYNVYIRFTGKAPTGYDDGSFESYDEVVYSTNNSGVNLSRFGLSILTSGNTTIIRFIGVKGETNSGIANLSKYHIKTVLASTSDSYHWGDEEQNNGDVATNTDILVYDKKVAKYSAIQNVGIKNLSGTTLDTSGHLNLTEDFSLVTMWSPDVEYSERLDFNSRILLTRKFNDNGVSGETQTYVQSGTIITLPGIYTARVVNDLGMQSNEISFTRGEGEISMYAVYAVNSINSTEKNVSPSSLVTIEDDKVLFTYFITNDYFSYKDNESNIVTVNDIEKFKDSTSLTSELFVNTSASKYLDVRVNSNLSIRADIYSIDIDSFGYPYVQYIIYSKTQTNEIYTYRYVRITFVTISDTNLANVTVKNEGDTTNLADNTAVVTSTAKNLQVDFTFIDETIPLVPFGDTLYLDRYYNGQYIETTTINITTDNVPKISLDISNVGLHEFVLKDLAGRTHKFNGADKLQIYLINQILYTINDENPINNQIFNEAVNVDIIFTLSELQLYNQRSLNIVITKNGQETNIPNNDGHFTISEAGYYTVQMSATTLLTNGNATQISSTYNFVIINELIATRSFSLSKGTGFTIDKIIKIINGERNDITTNYITQSDQVTIYAADKTTALGTLTTGMNVMIDPESYDPNSEYNKIIYNNSATTTLEGYIKTKYLQISNDGQGAKIINATNTLLWLTHSEQGNSIFEITLKYYEQISKSYRTFTFRVWINDEAPNIISSIPSGTSTKDTININFNPGLIYSQIGTGYITLNDKRVTEIDANSPQAVETITITQKGTYWVKIYSENGTLVGSYKFVKNEPINQLTKIIIVCVAIGIVVVIALFFFLRRKGKYR